VNVEPIGKVRTDATDEIASILPDLIGEGFPETALIYRAETLSLIQHSVRATDNVCGDRACRALEKVLDRGLIEFDVGHG